MLLNDNFIHAGAAPAGRLAGVWQAQRPRQAGPAGPIPQQLCPCQNWRSAQHAAARLPEAGLSAGCTWRGSQMPTACTPRLPHARVSADWDDQAGEAAQVRLPWARLHVTLCSLAALRKALTAPWCRPAPGQHPGAHRGPQQHLGAHRQLLPLQDGAPPGAAGRGHDLRAEPLRPAEHRRLLPGAPPCLASPLGPACTGGSLPAPAAGAAGLGPTCPATLFITTSEGRAPTPHRSARMIPHSSDLRQHGWQALAAGGCAQAITAQDGRRLARQMLAFTECQTCPVRPWPPDAHWVQPGSCDRLAGGPRPSGHAQLHMRLCRLADCRSACRTATASLRAWATCSRGWTPI